MSMQIRSAELVMPSACQNGAETTDIGRHLEDKETFAHLQSSSWPEHVKRPPKR
jgi:hypothetical protein